MTNHDTTLTRFNAMEKAAAVAEMEKLCGSKRWCESMADSRPYTERSSIHEAAGKAFDAVADKDWLEAFSHHPRIGDINSLRLKYAGNRDWSLGEQAGAVGVSEGVLGALAKGNVDYANQFGFQFIVCATGKTASEMLELLLARLNNAKASELKIAAAEQRKITHLRIDKWSLENNE